MPRDLPAYRLIAEPLSPEAASAQGFEWAAPEIGRRHQLGGTPSWLQDDDTPRCPDCREPMTFYAQLDAVGDEYDLADCGLIYVFICFNEFQTASVFQSA